MREKHVSIEKPDLSIGIPDISDIVGIPGDDFEAKEEEETVLLNEVRLQEQEIEKQRQEIENLKCDRKLKQNLLLFIVIMVAIDVASCYLPFNYFQWYTKMVA